MIDIMGPVNFAELAVLRSGSGGVADIGQVEVRSHLIDYIYK